MPFLKNESILSISVCLEKPLRYHREKEVVGGLCYCGGGEGRMDFKAP